MKGTVNDYIVAIKWYMDVDGVEAANAGNHRMLKEGNITLEAFQAAAKIIADAFLKR